MAGIHGSDEGCYSLALSGGYEDDLDYGVCFTYTGEGTIVTVLQLACCDFSTQNITWITIVTVLFCIVIYVQWPLQSVSTQSHC